MTGGWWRRGSGTVPDSGCCRRVGLALMTGCNNGANDFKQDDGNSSGGSKPTATGSPAPTATPVRPALSPARATLFAGPGDAPNCNGSRQTITVTGARPPFTVATEAGCVEPATLAASGDSFTLIAGSALGEFALKVADADGVTTTGTVTVRGVSAQFVKVDLLVAQRSDNGDGSYSSVVGALVTDANGVVVGDGVPVEFTLVDAVSGVSVTSPGLTNQAAPCTLSFPAVAQPGDALSCLKYAAALQGSTVRIRARVRTTSGEVDRGHAHHHAARTPARPPVRYRPGRPPRARPARSSSSPPPLRRSACAAPACPNRPASSSGWSTARRGRCPAPRSTSPLPRSRWAARS